MPAKHTTGEVEAELVLKRKNLRAMGIVGSMLVVAFTLGMGYMGWSRRMDDMENGIHELTVAIRELSQRVSALEKK